MTPAENKQEERFQFVYKGLEYDATDYVHKHPGGAEFMQKMKGERKDITEYFRALHSDTAEKILQSFPQLSKAVPSKDSKKYFKMLEKVKHLYKPDWFKQAFFISLVALTFLIACFTKSALVSMLCFAFSQVVAGWLAHSMNHSRDKKLHNIGDIVGPLLAGMSTKWWGQKHNMHHMFTNSTRLDDDIQHEYSVPSYPFLYVKWRLDAFTFALKRLNKCDLLYMTINYALIVQQKLIYFFVGILIGGFYSANLVLGNHEREKRYNNQIQDDFMEHQITTCRNYPYEGLFWLIIMGGMQYHTEHHLFPQIPFYHLPTAKNLIAEELSSLNKEINIGPVL